MKFLIIVLLLLTSFGLHAQQNNTSQASTTNQSRLKYQDAEKDKDIIQKQLLISKLENQLQRQNIWIGIVASIVFIIAIMFIRLSLRIRHYKQKMATFN